MAFAASVGVILSLVLLGQWLTARRDVSRLIVQVQKSSADQLGDGLKTLKTALVSNRRMRVLGQLLGYWAAGLVAGRVLPENQHGDIDPAVVLIVAIVGSFTLGTVASYSSLRRSTRLQAAELRVALLEPRTRLAFLDRRELMLQYVLVGVIGVAAVWSLALGVSSSTERIENLSVALAAILALIAASVAAIAEVRLAHINLLGSKQDDTRIRSLLVSLSFGFLASSHLRVLSILSMLFTFWAAGHVPVGFDALLFLIAIAQPIAVVVLEARTNELHRETSGGTV